MYAILHDFQTLIAALVALIAALIAYGSSWQRTSAARKQAARDKRHSLRMAHIERMRRREAILIFVQMMVANSWGSIGLRLLHIKALSELTTKLSGTQINESPSWKYLENIKPLRLEWPLELNWSDLSNLTSGEQSQIHSFIVTLGAYDEAVESARANFRGGAAMLNPVVETLEQIHGRIDELVAWAAGSAVEEAVSAAADAERALSQPQEIAARGMLY